MVGAGFGAFSVMGYVIANMKPDKTVGFQVELNSKLLAATFGETEDSIVKAIEFLCEPDLQSRTPSEGGRRLVKVGQFAYRVVNGVLYDEIRNEEERRDQNRLAQQRHRGKKNKIPKSQDRPPSGKYLAAEKRHEQAVNDCDEKLADKIAAGEA